MKQIIRKIGLYISWLKYKYIQRDKVCFLGFTPIYSFKGSSIELGVGGGKTRIFSSPYSNMLGLYQRSIIVAKYGGKIKIGGGTGMSGASIYAIDKIEIGRNCIIGANTKIFDSDLHPLHEEIRHPHLMENVKRKPVIIGDECFIGANCLILKGTKLGRNCVVGAGSVVSGSFPDNVIIAGNPARIVKENVLN